MPRKRFLQILDIPHDNSKPIDLIYDLEWLSVLHLTNHLLNINSNVYYLPGSSTLERSVDKSLIKIKFLYIFNLYLGMILLQLKKKRLLSLKCSQMI